MMDSTEGLPKGLAIKPVKPDIVTLSTGVEDLMNIQTPFEYPAKLEPLIVYPDELMQILIDRFPHEDNVVKVERNMATMGWAAEAITAKKDRSPEETRLLRKSVDILIDTLKHTDQLGAHSTAAGTLLRFKLTDEDFLEKLRNLGTEIYDAILTEQEGPGMIKDTYRLRGYVWDNDLLEDILDRLQETGSNDPEILKSIASKSTDKEHYLRLRIIYKARDWLKQKQ